MIDSHSQTDPDALLTEQEAAGLAHLSVRSLQGWRVKGGGPRFAKLGKSVRYRRRDLAEWIEARLTSSTSEASAK